MEHNAEVAGGPCAMHSSPRVYIASPFFTPSQLAELEAVTDICHRAGYVTYSPLRDGVLLPPNAPPEQRAEVYQSNVAAIRASDIMVAIVDDKDTGTTWEFGGANLAGIPVVSVSAVTKRRNVMLSEGVLAHVETHPDLESVLVAFRPYLTYGRRVTLEDMLHEKGVRSAFNAAYKFRGETQ